MTLSPLQEEEQSFKFEGNDERWKKRGVSKGGRRRRFSEPDGGSRTRCREYEHRCCADKYCLITTTCSEDNRSSIADADCELQSTDEAKSHNSKAGAENNLNNLRPRSKASLSFFSSERLIADHNYCSASNATVNTFDNNLTWAFTQPSSSHVRQIREIQKGLYDRPCANSGWNYANPMNRYVELCSDDPWRCSSDIEEVVEKYFKVTSFGNVSVQQNLAAAATVARCRVNEEEEEEGEGEEPIAIEVIDPELILDTIDQAIGATVQVAGSSVVAGEEEMATVIGIPPGAAGEEGEEGEIDEQSAAERPAEKKISLLGVHFLQDKKMFLLQTSHTVKRTARERYQHLTKVFRFPGKMMGSNFGLGGSCRRISRFLNDECWTEASGRRETCIVTQNISRTNNFVDALPCPVSNDIEAST